MDSNISQEEPISPQEQAAKAVFEPVILSTQHLLKKWRWEQDRAVLLSEFSKDKADEIREILTQHFSHNWDHQSIKFAPEQLTLQLGELAKLTPVQSLFTIPATSTNPAMLAILWPWGHGGTLSLRLKVLDSSYDYVPVDYANLSFMEKIKYQLKLRF